MASNDNQQIIDLLRQLVKATGSGRTGYEAFKHNDSSSGDESASITREYEKLRNIIANNSNLSNKWVESIKKMTGHAIDLEEVFDELEKGTRNLNKVQRDQIQSLGDMLKKSKDYVATLEKTNIAAAKILKNDMDHIVEQEKLKKITDELIESQKKQAELNKQLADSESNLKRRRGRNANDKKADELRLTISSLKAQLDKLNPAIVVQQESQKAVAAGIDEFYESVVEINKITKSLSDEQLDMLKKGPAAAKSMDEYIKALETAKADAANIGNATTNATRVIADSAKRGGKFYEGAIRNVAAGLMNVGKMLFTDALPKAFADYMSQVKNNVAETNYGQAAAMGLSESERDEFIGQNRQQIRSVGAGDEKAGMANFQQLQLAATQFGVLGKEAANLAAQFQSEYTAMGFNGQNVEGIKEQMNVQHQMASQLGVTNEALASFYDTLIQTGQMAALQQKYANQNEADRQKSINNEIYQRGRLNTVLGLSFDRQKQLLQESTNQKYQGIADSIKRGISSTLETQTFGKAAGVSDADLALVNRISRYDATGQTLSDPKERARFTEAKQKMAAARLAGRSDAYNKAVNTGDDSDAYRYMVYDQQQQTLGRNDQSDESELANERAKSVGQAGGADRLNNVVNNVTSGNNTSTENSVVGGVGNASDLNKSTYDTTKNLVFLGEKAAQAAQYLDGIGKHPLAGTVSTGLSALIGGVASKYLSTGIEKVLKSVLGRGGVAAGASEAATVGTAATEAATAATAAAEAATAGAAATTAGTGLTATALAASAGLVVAAGAVGYGVGTLISKYGLEGTRAGDSIGKGVTKVAAFLGSDTAKEALNNDARFNDNTPDADGNVKNGMYTTRHNGKTINVNQVSEADAAEFAAYSKAQKQRRENEKAATNITPDVASLAEKQDVTNKYLASIAKNTDNSNDLANDGLSKVGSAYRSYGEHIRDAQLSVA